LNEQDDIQDLLKGLLGDDAPFTPQKTTALNTHRGDAGEAAFAVPDAFIPTESSASEAEPEAQEAVPASAVEPSIATPKVSLLMPTFTNDEIAETLDIRQFGTLVTLQTSRWHAKVKDRAASQAAAAAAGASDDAFETHKRLLVGADEKLKRIHKAIDTARTRHYQMTLPWSTVSASDTGVGKRTGARLLPNTLFMEYTQEMAKAKGEMEAALADFVPAYPTLIEAAKQKLGTRFDQSEYPNASAIEGHFGLSFDFAPVPQGGDFQGLADAQVKRLADTLNKKTRVMLENAMQESWSRLYEVVSHAAEKLSSPDAMFHYTMVDKLREAAKLVKHLNVTNDNRIEEVRAFVERHLTMYDVDDIRKDENLRKQMANHAREAVELMEKGA
jgi:hypothetical protein